MIPIVYCGNDRIFEGIFLSATSIARRTNEDIKIIILTMNYTKINSLFLPITNEHIALLDSALKTFNKNNGCEKIDLTKEFVENFEGGKNVKNLYTPYALLRLLMDDEKIMPYDKAIYLDMDTMAFGDIKVLWNIDISEYEYGATLDFMGKFWVHKDYCNSGVLLLNLKKMRETELFKKARKILYNKKFFMPDQTAIYDATTKKLIFDGFRFNEQRDVKEDTIIKHFNKGIIWFPFFKVYNIKQWQRDKVHKQLKISCFDIDYKFYDDFMQQHK